MRLCNRSTDVGDLFEYSISLISTAVLRTAVNFDCGWSSCRANNIKTAPLRKSEHLSVSFDRTLEHIESTFIFTGPVMRTLISSMILLRWPFMSWRGSIGDISYLFRLNSASDLSATPCRSDGTLVIPLRISSNQLLVLAFAFLWFPSLLLVVQFSDLAPSVYPWD